MKILIIVGSFKTGGAERMSINTGEELLKRGFDVHYIVQRPIFEIPNTIPKERITILRKKNDQSVFYKIRSLFFGVYNVSRRINPDLVIAFSRFSSFLACFTFNTNIIARFDMNPYTLNRKQRIWANYVLNFPGVKKVVVPSTGMLKALKEKKPKYSNKFIVIPNSIRSITVNKRAEEPVSEKFKFTNYISAMGRLSAQKNFELLIKGFSKSRISDKFKLVIVGDGNLKDKLIDFATKNSVENKIIFTGQLENPFPVIDRSSFFVNTSTRESFCNVILEALTLSKPVIATDCDYGPSDMIDNGENGFLIESNNLDQLVDKLNSLGEDNLLIDKMSANAKKSSLRFQIDYIGNEWENLIKNIVI